MALSRHALVCALVAAAVLPATGQQLPTLPGAWPLTGQRHGTTGAAVPLPDRRIEIPAPAQTGILPGVDVSAGYLFEGQDPTRPRTDEQIRPSDRTIPREANDQARAVPGMTITVPLGR